MALLYYPPLGEDVTLEQAAADYVDTLLRTGIDVCNNTHSMRWRIVERFGEAATDRAVRAEFDKRNSDEEVCDA